MADGEADASFGANLTETTVGDLALRLKRVVEDAFGLVRVRGEISGYRGPHSSGHAYFALKDEKARLEAVIWRGVLQKLQYRPEEGMEVIATGRLTTYPGTSKYQIVIEALEPAGAGALMALLEQRKKKLAAEGLFDPARKQLLPYMPRVIGVVTSPTGAVIRDVLHRIADRFPLHVIVWPVRVQGETCGAEVAAAVAGFNAIAPGGPIPRPDLVIVARGGGSIEDLWGFNDEAAVRAVAQSAIPVVSAIGHETDWTLIDLAADLRAPTPTGAAELSVPVKADLEALLATLRARMRQASARGLDQARMGLRAALRGLGSPDRLVAAPRQRLDTAAIGLQGGLRQAAQSRRAQFNATAGRLSPGLLRGEVRQKRALVDALSKRRIQAGRALLERGSTRLGSVSGRMRPSTLAQQALAARQRLDAAARAQGRAADALLEACRSRLGSAWRLAQSLSYAGVLERGYAVIRDRDGKPVTRAAEIATGAAFRVEMRDGNIDAMATGAAANPPRKPARKAESGGQGDLF
jgi:exodeoxyribonuclease VII large subunit